MCAQNEPRELLHAIDRGEQYALRKLWSQWAAKVQNFARLQLASCGAEADMLAQEVTSDVFFALWNAPLAFDGRGAFSTWLYTLARNKAVDCLRRRQSTGKVEIMADVQDYLYVADPALIPEERYAAVQQMHRVLHCLQQLPNPSQREALILWAWEGMSLAQIAAVQKCSENTVKTRIFYGRKSLQGCLVPDSSG